MTRFAAIVLSLVMMAEPALAHTQVKGIGAFYSGLLHPMLVPAHLLLLIGLGLLLGQHPPRLGRLGCLAFVSALSFGLAAGEVASVSISPALLWSLALCAGLLVALEHAWGWQLIVVLAMAAGVAIGLDSTPEGSQQRETWLALAGTAIGAVVMLGYVAWFAASLVRPWQRIGIRVAGSWTAASAGMVLALALSGPKAAG